jgi:hypothetical protein
LNDFLEDMENSSFGFTTPQWACRGILKNLKHGESSVDELREDIQLLAPCVDET